MDLTNSNFTTPPAVGEKTGGQTVYGSWGQAGSYLQTFGLGVDAEPFPGTYANYRRMSSNPTLALAKAVKVQPMLTSSWGWQAREGVSDEVVGFVRGMFDPMRVEVLDEMMMALDMGNQTHELEWDRHVSVKPGLPSTRYVIRKMKPLAQEGTTVRLTQQTQKFNGVRNGTVDLDPLYCFHYPYDFKRGGWYGRSLHENCRAEFCTYERDGRELAKLVTKLSSVIAIAKVIRGMAKDGNGKVIDRYDAAKKLIGGLSQAQGAVFESIAMNADDVRNNPELLKITDIMLEVLDLGNTAPALTPMLQKRKDAWSEFMMAWQLPPRTALEGQHGTLAEAGVHADVGITGSELDHAHATRWFAKHVVNKVLVVNFGPDYADAVWPVASPILDEKRAILIKILDGIIANGPLFEVALTNEIDVDDVYNQLGVPKRQQVAGGGAAA